MNDTLKVGGIPVPISDAVHWVSTYLDADRNRREPDAYSYPAYDCYDAEHNDPRGISDADLLAPFLLNVRISVRAYYGLQAVRERLEAALRSTNAKPLALASEADVRGAAKAIYGLLDGKDRPPEIGATKLSKI